MDSHMDSQEERVLSSPKRTRRNIAAVAVAASLVLMPIEGAEGHRFKQSSTHRLRWDKPKFKGRVKSDREWCKKNRKINIHRIRPGANPIVATTFTNNEGRYSVNPARKIMKRRDYYAIAKRKRKKKHRHLHVCKKARSNTVTV